MGGSKEGNAANAISKMSGTFRSADCIYKTLVSLISKLEMGNS